MLKKMKRLSIVLSLSIVIAGCQKKELVATTAQMTDTETKTSLSVGPFYVSTTGSDTNDGLAASVTGGHGPWKTLSHAAATVSTAGSTVNILPGDYYKTVGGDDVFIITYSGTSGNPIVYQANDSTNKPKIHALATDNIYKCIAVTANFITIRNLELIGDNSNLAGLTKDASAKFETNGIQFGGFGSGTAYTDFQIHGCLIHDFPGAGVAVKEADKMTIEANIVHDNALYSTYSTSGISILDPTNTGTASNGTLNGDSLHVKILVRRNLCYNNQEKIGTFSDGNGIIIDVNRAISSGNPYGDYNGWTKVENNICSTNGGAGINVVKAQHVIVTNNTCSDNGLNNGYSELHLDNNCIYVYFNNNIAYNDQGGLPYSSNSSTHITYDYNLYYANTTPAKIGTHDVVGNPKFIASPPYNYTAGSSTSAATFDILTNSPAKNAGTNVFPFYTYWDYTDGYRSDGMTDIGAFEYGI